MAMPNVSISIRLIPSVSGRREFRAKKPGRMVICSKCSHTTAQGTTQVHRKIVFHFCRTCWTELRVDCMEWMEKVAGTTPQKVAA